MDIFAGLEVQRSNIESGRRHGENQWELVSKNPGKIRIQKKSARASNTSHSCRRLKINQKYLNYARIPILLFFFEVIISTLFISSICSYKLARAILSFTKSEDKIDINGLLEVWRDWCQLPVFLSIFRTGKRKITKLLLFSDLYNNKEMLATVSYAKWPVKIFYL